MTMASYPTKEVQDEFLNAIRKSQETVIEAVRTWVDTVQSMRPKVPSARMPLSERMPKPEEVVAGAYDFAEKLLSSQRQFAEELLKATAPLMPGEGKSTQKEGKSTQKMKAAAAE
jgi:cell division septum initiation protein DivIVA